MINAKLAKQLSSIEKIHEFLDTVESKNVKIGTFGGRTFTGKFENVAYVTKMNDVIRFALKTAKKENASDAAVKALKQRLAEVNQLGEDKLVSLKGCINKIKIALTKFKQSIIKTKQKRIEWGIVIPPFSLVVPNADKVNFKNINLKKLQDKDPQSMQDFDKFLQSLNGDNYKKDLCEFPEAFWKFGGVSYAILSIIPEACEYLPQSIKEDRDALLNLTTQYTLPYIDKKWSKDREFCLGLISQASGWIDKGSNEIRPTPYMKDKYTRQAFDFAAGSFRKDKEFLRQMMVKTQGDATYTFKFLPEKLQKDKDFILSWVSAKTYTKIFASFDKSLIEDEKFLLELVRVRPLFYLSFPDEKARDVEFAKKAFAIDPEVKDHFPWTILADPANQGLFVIPKNT